MKQERTWTYCRRQILTLGALVALLNISGAHPESAASATKLAAQVPASADVSAPTATPPSVLKESAQEPVSQARGPASVSRGDVPAHLANPVSVASSSPALGALSASVGAVSTSASGVISPASSASSPSAQASSPTEPDPYSKVEGFGVALLALAVVAPAALLALGWWRDRKQSGPAPLKSSSIIWWSVAFAMAATSVIYAFARRDTIAFWDGMVGSWLATLLGIVCGVPVALELERQRRRTEDVAKANAAKRLRIEVLTLLREELELVAQQLKDRIKLANGLPKVPLKTSIWDVTRASGNLTAISEPDLLQVFSEAYRWIGMIASLEKQRIEVMFGNDRTFPDGKFASEKLEEELRQFLKLASDTVSEALSFTAPLVTVSTTTP
jgi:hypothetical protein